MERVIIYDSDCGFASSLSQRIKSDISDVEIDNFTSIDELKSGLSKDDDRYIFSIIDIDKDDENFDEVVNLLSKQFIPILILTKKENISYRDEMINKYPIIDYATKDSSKNFHYIISMINHMRNSKNIEVLLVSNSEHDRKYMNDNLLRRYPFNIVEATDKLSVQRALVEHENIKIMIIDMMPEEEALQIVEEVREIEPKDSLAIMAITSIENTYLATKYLQLGANDFVVKPISVDTFYSRMNVMIETLSLFQRLQKLANMDFLTSLYNRRYFYEAGKLLYASGLRKNIKIAAAMLDIDFFKSINDTYGHGAGDIVLKEVAHIIKSSFRSSDLVARVGGEEFSIILVDAEEEKIINIFEKLRSDIEALDIDTPEGNIKVTISIGVTLDLCENLEKMIKKSDSNLYEAKQTGRNKIVLS
jgi:diguanylate cyclase (GGDEF)-like protein